MINSDWCTAKEPVNTEIAMAMADKYDLRKQDEILAFVYEVLDYQCARSAYLCETLSVDYPESANILMMASDKILSTPIMTTDD